MRNSIPYVQEMISNKWQNCFNEKESFYTALFLRKRNNVPNWMICLPMQDVSFDENGLYFQFQKSHIV